jgi:hypothetical protein
MKDWSRSEVEATVADYFAMLEHEVRGEPYNKTAHRKALASRLEQRSDAAIERKHQNISAILIDLGFVFIAGYKPLGNYQRLLFEVVQERLVRSAALADAVRQQVMAPAPLPTVDDILATLEEPPASIHGKGRPASSLAREAPMPRPGVDYFALEASNRSLGEAGEEFVVRFEKARLLRAGQERLAGRVEQVSKTRGDGLGYDVLSFDASGDERWIEVKTTRYGASAPFYVTRRELAVSRESSDRFQLYRTYEFDRRPRLFCRSGSLEVSFRLQPSQFLATLP